MKFKKIFIIILFIFLTIPFVSAKSEYDDIVADILGKEINSEKLTIYFFHGDGCPHCAKEEKFLKEIEAEYGEYVEIVKLEVWEDDENYSYLDIVKSKLNVSNKNVPFTVLGSNYYIGYSNTVKSQIINNIKKYINYKNNINNNFEDIVADIVGREANKEKLTIYLFYGDGCPHCAEEETFLKKLEKKYKENIEIVKYEVWKNEANSSFLKQVKNKFMSTSTGVPFTVIGKNYYVGYSDTVGSQIENNIKEYLSSIGEDIDLSNKIKLPFLGYVDGKKVSLPLVGVVLGVIDGFNPCAMWVLLFIINMLFGMENRKRMWILGVSFLLTSGFIYFLAMLGISSALSVASIIWIRKLIGVVALIGGLLNLKNYLKTKNDGCHVVDEKKRKSMFKKIRKFTTEKSFILALIGVITLAVSVNLVELACSLGFPAIYSSLLGINNIVGLEKIIYLLIYTLFYLIDDLVIFVIAMSTLRLTGISTKYNKYSHLIGGTIMFIIGLLLIFKPEWLMFNFN